MWTKKFIIFIFDAYFRLVFLVRVRRVLVASKPPAGTRNKFFFKLETGEEVPVVKEKV